MKAQVTEQGAGVRGLGGRMEIKQETRRTRSPTDYLAWKGG